MSRFREHQRVVVTATDEIVEIAQVLTDDESIWDYLTVSIDGGEAECNYLEADLSPLPKNVVEMVTMTLKVLGADGLILKHNDVVYCQCRHEEEDFMQDLDCTLCVPARLVNGELVPMEE